MYIDEALRKYIDDARSGKSTPGGGSVSALVGALGTTMGEMAANFTVGREKFKDVEPEVKEILSKLESHREALLKFTIDDIEMYSKVTNAYGLPKGTDEEKT